MKSLLRLCALSMWVLGALACAGPPPGPQTPTNAAGEQGGKHKQGGPGSGAIMAEDEEAMTGLDLSPVKAPVEIVASLRWQSPAATIAALASYAKMPAGFIDNGVRQLVQEAVADGLDELVDPKRFADVVTLDAPVDFIVAVDMKQTQPRPMLAAALGLASLRGALAAAKGRPEPMGPGMWKLGAEASYGPRCVIAASGGSSPARLVCGERFQQLEKLAPYMARTMPTQVGLPVDARLELRLRGLAQRYGAMLHSQARGLPVLAEEFKLDIRAFDEALMDAATALAEEAGALIYDLDTVQLDVDVDEQRGLQLTGAMQFAGKRSWLVEGAVDGADLAGPAPDPFWRLPQDSDGVSWSRTSDPGRYAQIFKTLQRLLEGGLEKIHFGTPADRSAIAKLLRLPFGKHVASAGATGHFSGTTSAAPAVSGPLAELFGSSLGWQIFGFEEGASSLRSYLQEAVATYNRPTLQQALKKELDSDAVYMPTVRIVPAPRALGGGSLDLEITVRNVEDPFEGMPPDASPDVRSSGTPKTTTLTFHVLLMADGATRTWIGFAANRDRLAQLMATTKGAAPGAASLAQRPGLEMFRRGRHTSGGMTSLQAFIEAIKPGVETAMQSGGGSGDLQQVMQMLERLPNKGKSPIVFYGTAVDAARPSTSFEITVPAGTLEDVGFIVRNAVAMIR